MSISIGNGGVASAIGQSDADPSNLVLEGGTLQYAGSDATTDRGFTLVNGGAGAPVIEVNSSTNLTFTGQVTSPDDAGLTKTGTGTLTLANDASDYIGVTTINAGVLSVDTLANGGDPSGIGAATSASANLVLAGGTLQYTGTGATPSSNRGFTLGSGGGHIDVNNAGTTLTISGTAVGSGGLTKDGAGTLVLSGTNTYTGATRVTAGTLRAGSTQAFGPPATVGLMTVDSGATLDLNSLNNTVGGLSGAGTVTLGSATLTTRAGGTFTGTIGGTGGLTHIAGTQTMTGCNNDYTGITTIGGGTLATNCLQGRPSEQRHRRIGQRVGQSRHPEFRRVAVHRRHANHRPRVHVGELVGLHPGRQCGDHADIHGRCHGRRWASQAWPWNARAVRRQHFNEHHGHRGRRVARRDDQRLW